MMQHCSARYTGRYTGHGTRTGGLSVFGRSVCLSPSAKYLLSAFRRRAARPAWSRGAPDRGGAGGAESVESCPPRSAEAMTNGMASKLHALDAPHIRGEVR